MITLHFFKRTLIAALFTAFTFAVNSQSYTIASPLGNGTFYIGMEHDISGFVEGYKCKDIFLVADRGKLVNLKENKCIFSSDTFGTVNISIYVRKGTESKKVGNSKFEVIEWPSPVAIIGGKKNNDTTTRKSLLAQGGVAAKYMFCCFDGLAARVISFHAVIIKKDGSASKSCYNESNVFTNEMREFMATIGDGDQLLVYSILAKTALDNKISIAPLMLNVAE